MTQIKVCNKNNEFQIQHPATPDKSNVQIVNNYQSITIATKTHSPGVTGDVDPLLNLIAMKKKTYLIENLHVADSLEVSFAKFTRAVFRNPIFDL